MLQTKEQRQKMRNTENNNSTKPEIKEILLEYIITDFKNVRSQYDNQSIIELAVSIERYGLIQPITVLKKDEQYKIIAGHRRFLAFQHLRSQDKPTYSLIPAIVKNSIKDIEEIQLIENIQRENLSPADIEKAVLSIIEMHGITKEQAAKRIGKSRQWVTMIFQAHEVRESASQLADTLDEPEITSRLVNTPSSTLAELSGLEPEKQKKAIGELRKKEKPTQKAARAIKNEIQGKTKPVTDTSRNQPANKGKSIRQNDNSFIPSAGASLNSALLFIQRRKGHFDKSELSDISKNLCNVTRELLYSLKDKEKAELIKALKKELTAI